MPFRQTRSAQRGPFRRSGGLADSAIHLSALDQLTRARSGQMTDEQLDAAIAALEEMIARKAGERGEVVPGLPGPDVFADRPVKAAANGAKESEPRKRPQTPV